MSNKHSCFSTFHPPFFFISPFPLSLPLCSSWFSSRFSVPKQPIVPACRCHGSRELSVAHVDLSSYPHKISERLCSQLVSSQGLQVLTVTKERVSLQCGVGHHVCDIKAPKASFYTDRQNTQSATSSPQNQAYLNCIL